MKKIVIVIAVLSFIGASLYILGYVLPFSFVSREAIVNRSNCNDAEMATNESIDGVVTQKIRDNQNHMWKTIEYSNSSGSHQTLIFRNDESGAYEFLMQGDSIFKDTNSLELKVVRDTIMTKYLLNYGCIQEKVK